MFKYFRLPYIKWVFYLVIAVWWSGILYFSYSDGVFDWKFAVIYTGILAWYLLIYTIFISLLHKLLPRVLFFGILLPLRKETGVFAFLIAGSHAVFEFLKQGVLWNAKGMLEATLSSANLAYLGTIAFLIMLPLFLTSTNWAVKKMGARAWKNLHRMAHVAFLVAGIHVMLNKYFQPDGYIQWKTVGAFSFYFLGYGYLWAKRLMSKKVGLEDI